jgi:hypothetical protein
MTIPKGCRALDNPAQCMVVGCERVAIYRNAVTAQVNRSQGIDSHRGYCSKHKEMAVSKSNSKLVDALCARYEAQERRRLEQ